MWELLPTDYEDVKYEGKKRYDISKNSDGSVCIRDITHYINLEKTFFGAEQANRMNQALNKIMNALEVKKIDLYKEFNDYFIKQQKMFAKKAFEILETFKQEMLTIRKDQKRDFDDWFLNTTKIFRDLPIGNLLEYIEDTRKLLMKLYDICINNDFTAHLLIEDDQDGDIILVDDSRNAILADWKYEEL